MKKTQLIIVLFCMIFILLTSCSKTSSSEAVPVKTVPTQLDNKMRDCTTDLNCFIESASQGHDANMTYTASVDLFGMTQTSTSYLEISNCNVNCTYYTKYIKVNSTFAAGTPTPIIEQNNQMNNFMIGRNGTCIFNKNDLVAMLQRWNSSEFSTEDYANVDCKGSAFESFAITLDNNTSNEIAVTPITVTQTSCILDTECKEGSVCIDSECVSPAVISDCDKYSFSLDEAKCIKTIAVANNNKEQCDLIAAKNVYSTIQVDCYVELAFKLRSMDMCPSSLEEYDPNVDRKSLECVTRVCNLDPSIWIMCPTN